MPDAADYLTVYDLDDLGALDARPSTGDRPAGGLPGVPPAATSGPSGPTSSLTGAARGPRRRRPPSGHAVRARTCTGPGHDLADAAGSRPVAAELDRVPEVRGGHAYRQPGGHQVVLVELAAAARPRPAPPPGPARRCRVVGLRRQFLAHHGEGTDEGP